MPHHPGKTSRELVIPNRDRLRSLRDQYMRDLEATSYDKVRDKFLQELKSKRGPREAEDASAEQSPRERGAGIWNSAFARKGQMLRSSIILLAEFFDVKPEELILQTSRDDSPQTEEVETMSNVPVEPAMKLLVAFHQHSPKLDLPTRSLCQQLIERLEQYLKKPLSELIGEGHPPDEARLREAILQLTRTEPSVRILVLRISQMSSTGEESASRVFSPYIPGEHAQVFTNQGDIHTQGGLHFGHVIHMGPGRKDGNGSTDS